MITYICHNKNDKTGENLPCTIIDVRQVYVLVVADGRCHFRDFLVSRMSGADLREDLSGLWTGRKKADQ